MGAMLDAFKSLTPRQIAVLIAVLLGSAGTMYGAYASVGGSGRLGLNDDQDLPYPLPSDGSW
jgi:hypothetical protein